RTYWVETILPARCRRNRPRLHLSPEMFPAMYWPSIYRRDEVHRPTRTSFPINRRAPQIQTPLPLVNVCPPISRTLPRQGTRCAALYIFPCFKCRLGGKGDDASPRLSRSPTIDNVY